MVRNTRPISWVKAARKEFKKFPLAAQKEIATALTVAAEGSKSDIAKPLKGLGVGVMEVALAHRGEAYRTVYCLQLDSEIWVVHAFQKKSKAGLKTPQSEIELIQHRIKRLKELLK